jgi:hypothetical protein
MQERVLILLKAISSAGANNRLITSSEIANTLAGMGQMHLLNSVRERLLANARRAGLIESRAGIWSLTNAGRAALLSGHVDLP